MRDSNILEGCLVSCWETRRPFWTEGRRQSVFRYTVECSPGDFHISCTYEGTTCGGFDPVGFRSFGVVRRL